MRFPFLRCGLALAALALFALAAAPSVQAQTIWIAVYGDNAIDDRINSGNPITGERYGLTNYQAVLVSAADITNGILQRTTNPFSAFVYTRPGNQPGPNLGGVAAQKVRDFVGSPATGMGNVVLLNGDFADALQAPMLGGGLFSDPNVERLIANAVIFAATPAGPGEARGHGFVGEYTGAIAGLTSNEETAPQRTALGFVEGNASQISFSGGNSDFAIFTTPEGASHPVMNGFPTPYNPTPGTSVSVEFGATITDVDPTLVVARYAGDTPGDNPAIIVRSAVPVSDPTLGAIPEPGTLVLLAPGLLPLLGMVGRRRKR